MPTDPSRRDVLRAGLGAGLGLLLARRPLWAAPPDGAEQLVILWLNGGPSHLDTFDPKPGAATSGGTRAIETAVEGLRFAEHFPQLAERADRLAVIRSLTSREGDHQRAHYLLRTGFTPSTTIRHPTLGSLVAAERPVAASVPAYVSLGPDPVGPGYRGVAHAAFTVDGGAGLLTPTAGVDAARRERRRALLATLEAPFAARAGLLDAAGQPTRVGAYARADALLTGPLRDALDAQREDPGTRDRYGRERTGQAVLAARRLLDAGVRCVEVRVDGWDDHQDLFQNLPGRARGLDRAFAALLDDLVARERLDRTLIVCMGEFGRTPDVNQRGGRDHYPRAFSAVLAGGGLRGGAVIGATCPEGREVIERPVTVADLHATLARRLGLDPAATRYAGDRPITLVDGGQPLRELLPA